jgi:hypothetical protein
MLRNLKHLLVVGLLPMSVAQLSCSKSSSTDDGNGNRADTPNVDPTGKKCGLEFTDLSQDTAPELQQAKLDQLTDPVARMLRRTCQDKNLPKNLGDIIDRMTTNNKIDTCTGDPKNIMRTMMISETSQPVNRAGPFRLVLSRGGCPSANSNNQTDQASFFMSVFTVGLNDNKQAISDSDTIELIGFQPDDKDGVTGVFNYYALQDTKGTGEPQWNFYGSSIDFIDARKPGSNSGAGDPSKVPGGLGSVEAHQPRRCAQCHPEGGLVQKELRAPWLHWETTAGGGALPGNMMQKVIANAGGLLGTGDTGIALEGLVEGKNPGYNQARLNHFLGKDKNPDILKNQKNPATLEKVLEPLFCTVEMNIDETSQQFFGTPGNFLLDDNLTNHISNADNTFSFFQFPACGTQFNAPCPGNFCAGGKAPQNNSCPQGAADPFDDKAFSAALARNASSVPQLPGVKDTFFRFAFPATSTITTDYITLLETAKVTDADFTRDVLFVDFPRPLFSDTRCDLLRNSNAKNVMATSVVGDISKVRAAFPGTALATKGDPKVQSQTVTAFVNKCSQRLLTDPTGMIDDIFRVWAIKRERARIDLRNPVTGVGVFEFPPTMSVSTFDPQRGGGFVLSPTALRTAEFSTTDCKVPH